nr:caspase family protein [Bradyrhizobium sp. AUGA SZCCT0169]
MQTFGNELTGADVALFYYAGHGVQVRNVNYLVPI